MIIVIAAARRVVITPDAIVQLDRKVSAMATENQCNRVRTRCTQFMSVR